MHPNRFRTSSGDWIAGCADAESAVRALTLEGSAARSRGPPGATTPTVAALMKRPGFGDLGKVADVAARGAPPGAVHTVGEMHCEASPWDSHAMRWQRERSPSRRHPATTRLTRNASPPFPKARLAAGGGEAVLNTTWIGSDTSPYAATVKAVASARTASPLHTPPHAKVAVARLSGEITLPLPPCRWAGE